MEINTPAEMTVAEMAQAIVQQCHLPSATYRFQFNSKFTFRDATALVPYLHQLGVTDCYSSPLLRARPGSSHGYDICDHTQLNPEVGTPAEFDALVAALHAHGMGLIFDMVPNHMGIDSSCNTWWMDVLENGPSSIYAPYFDVDWEPVKPELRNKVLLPILGDQYGNVLERGELQVVYCDGAFWLQYYDHILPIAPKTYTPLLSYQLDDLIATLGGDNEHVQELQSILTAISYLPSRDERDREKVLERNREKEIIKRRISNLYATSPEIQAAIDTAIHHFNGTVDDPHSFDPLDALINRQAYRPAFWRVATEEINYRRFFDINDLAAIRMEDDEVFHATHRLVFELLAQGRVNGLRIDHPDGLWNPPAYFQKLQIGFITQRIMTLLDEEADQAQIEQEVTNWFQRQLGEHGAVEQPLPLYVVAEKILSENEQIAKDWAVHGTTGYDFLNKLNGIFVDTRNATAFDRIYSEFIGLAINFADLVNATKKVIMQVSLVSQINEIGYQLERISERNRKYRDFTLNGLVSSLREVIAGLPVYRTYLTGAGVPSKQDQRHVRAAVRDARRRNPRTAEAIFAFIYDTLLLRNLATFRKEDQGHVINFVMRLQQITGPVMAKGLEDTAFYIYNRLASLNEVGGHPEHFGVALEDFHADNLQRQRLWPHAMLATSTHDTKRSEDVRTRISVLSEIPDEWRAALTRWHEMNAAHYTQIDDMAGSDLDDSEVAITWAADEPAPSRNDAYLFYQTLLGAWNEEQPGTPAFATFRQRIADYMQKATKEAKVRTSWINPNEAYDNAVRAFVLSVLPDEASNAFWEDFVPFQRRIAFYGRLNALAHTLFKLTVPGVPDTYQGSELWDFSLVDPDNRRPVDYQQRSEVLSALQQQVQESGENLVPLAQELLDTAADGRIKLYVLYRTLHLRRTDPDLYRQGAYTWLQAAGEKQDYVCAFARTLVSEHNGRAPHEVVVVGPRLVVGLTGGIEQPPLGTAMWQDTILLLPGVGVGQTYRNVFTGEVLTVREYERGLGLPLAEVCAHFPVALLCRL